VPLFAPITHDKLPTSRLSLRLLVLADLSIREFAAAAGITLRTLHQLETSRVIDVGNLVITGAAE